MKDKEILSCYKQLTEIETDYEALHSFLKYDTSLYKSKYIKNFLVNNKPLVHG